MGDKRSTTIVVGGLASAPADPLRPRLRRCVARHGVDRNDAEASNARAYASFNDLVTRALKPPGSLSAVA
jgi:hypothetical protein